ncbi:DUF4870 domain-containing protein [Candidatus Falkowbacteria bacterium]|jgi:fumarate reductase subunit D|nr:DUF4870 domain-containing protein [Candidatus Falkowbacteria bacterium]MBT7007241.1 DUF4870 domain-containing protein [Candidatus Falkowbacteria bacterium]
MQHEVFEQKDIDDSKAFAAIGYLGILCFVPLLLKKDSPYAQFHGKQGLVLFIAEVVLFFINIIPVLGQLVWLFASIVFLIISVIGLLKAWNGESWELPILGEYARKIKL